MDVRSAGKRARPTSAQRSGSSDALTEKQITLLQSFDIPFRLRRIRAIVKVINSAYDKATDRTGPDACKRSLADVVCRYEVAMTDTGDDLKQIEQIIDDDIDALLDVLAGQPESTVAQYGEIGGDRITPLESSGFGALKGF